jgi:hypothetical protein
MSGTSISPVQNEHPSIDQLHWSGGEKAIARKAFNKALDRELAEIVQQTRERVASLQQPSGLWDLEEFLTKRRKEIDRKYDYRYSQLPLVFGILVREGRLSLNDLKGLGEDKLYFIEAMVRL